MGRMLEITGRLCGENCRDRRCSSLAFKCSLAGARFIQHRTQREDVRARVSFFAVQLLRRHVLESAHNCSALGQGLARRGSVQGRRQAGIRWRNAPEQPWPAQSPSAWPRLGQHDVRRFQVAMHHAVRCAFSQARHTHPIPIFNICSMDAGPLRMRSARVSPRETP